MSETKSARPDVGSRDSVDDIVDGWHAELPSLDVSPVGIITRLHRIRSVVDGSLARTFADYGLTSADFQVLVTLRRQGAPFTLSPTQLASMVRLTQGTITVRIDRMHDRGWVTKSADPGDGRGSLVGLTKAGLQLFEEAAPAHLENENRLLSALTARERVTLEGLLRKLLVSLE